MDEWIKTKKNGWIKTKMDWMDGWMDDKIFKKMN